MTLDNKKIAGALLFVGSVQFTIALIIAEAVYPNYSVSANYISDLGVWSQRSAVIFNHSLILLGLLIVASSYFIQKLFKIRSITVLFLLAGIGNMGVGFFPENTVIVNGIPVVHSIAALLVFLVGGILAIYSCRITKSPFRYFSVIMGAANLVALALFFSTGSLGYLGIGVGGMERMIAYPTLLWMISFSGYLMADS